MISRVHCCSVNLLLFSLVFTNCIFISASPIHSPLISSTMDFVCSSCQEHNCFSFNVWSPLRSELCEKFLKSQGVCSLPNSGVSLPESANRMCCVTVNSINILYFLSPGSVLCVFFHGASNFRITTLCHLCVNL